MFQKEKIYFQVKNRFQIEFLMTGKDALEIRLEKNKDTHTYQIKRKAKDF